jgi:cell division protein FtsI (penicillin-binding protein 3)
MLPDIRNMQQINQALAIPLEPGRPAGAPARGPGASTATVDATARSSGSNRPNLTVPATILPPAITRPVQDIRRQTKLAPPPSPVASPTAPRTAPVLAVSTAAPVVAR